MLPSVVSQLFSGLFAVPQVKWSESHGAVEGHQSVGALYFSLPYMLKARKCVVLGSGAGFVPRIVLAAQRRLLDEGLIERLDVTLVDASIGIWGLPTYFSALQIDPKLRLVKKVTSDAAPMFSDIDYIHVDADHSYEGVRSDLQLYYPRLTRQNWAITVHDTANAGAVVAGLPIGAWEACRDFAKERGLSIINFAIGCGTALIMPG